MVTEAEIRTQVGASALAELHNLDADDGSKILYLENHMVLIYTIDADKYQLLSMY